MYTQCSTEKLGQNIRFPKSKPNAVKPKAMQNWQPKTIIGTPTQPEVAKVPIQNPTLTA